MNSREKLDQLVAKAKSTTPETEEQARIAQLIAGGLPLIAPMVPEDPAELDAMLLTLAQWCVSCRSDDCSPAAELVVAEAAPAGGA